MTFQQIATTRPSARRRNRLMAAAAVLVLIAAGAGVWQMAALREGGSQMTARSDVPVPPVAATTAVKAAPAPASWSTLTVYLAGSAEEAARMEEALAQSDSILAQFGRPPLHAWVLVAASAEEEMAHRQAIADADAGRAGFGLPPVTVVDLRAR